MDDAPRFMPVAGGAVGFVGDDDVPARQVVTAVSPGQLLQRLVSTEDVHRAVGQGSVAGEFTGIADHSENSAQRTDLGAVARAVAQVDPLAAFALPDGCRLLQEVQGGHHDQRVAPGRGLLDGVESDKSLPRSGGHDDAHARCAIGELVDAGVSGECLVAA